MDSDEAPKTPLEEELRRGLSVAFRHLMEEGMVLVPGEILTTQFINASGADGAYLSFAFGRGTKHTAQDDRDVRIAGVHRAIERQLRALKCKTFRVEPRPASGPFGFIAGAIENTVTLSAKTTEDLVEGLNTFLTQLGVEKDTLVQIPGKTK